jgi:nitrite reductase [NAD(P)H] large subunit
MPKRKLVVIGNGMTGVRVVEDILALSGADQFDIAVFGDEACPHYDRTLLPEVLAGARQERELHIHPLSWYADRGITLHSGSRVTELDRASQIVYARNGRRARYDMLVLATGSRSQTPPLTGIYDEIGQTRPGVFSFRTLEDCRRIARRASAASAVAVLGGGLHALETACALRRRGCSVHVLHRGARLMDTLLDSTRGDYLHAKLCELGIYVHLGRSATELTGGGSVTGVAFSDGTSLRCDLVILSEDLQPDVEIAIRAGLAVENAIVVDNHMRSVDDHDVYAVGQCAQHRGKVYEFVPQFWEQTAVCAQHITGRGRHISYRGSRSVTTLHVAGTALNLA